ncbi:hypothetical protein ACQPXT_21060 [Streptomyces sp. CA-100214]
MSRRPSTTARASSAPPRAVPIPAAVSAWRRQAATAMPVSAKTTAASGSQNAATSSTW